MAELVLSIFLQAFLPLFAIMDPFISVPAFISLTRKETAEKKRVIAFQAVAIAGGLLFLFLLFGNSILSALGITLSAMQVAGGIILGLMGLELVLGLSFPREKEKIGKVSPAALILGTPLITGPGVITTTILSVSEYGSFITAVAALAALVLTWLILRYSHVLYNAIGEEGSQLLSRIMGLILLTVAVQFALNGIRAAF